MQNASIVLPGCKSASQRALLLAALAYGDSRLIGLSDGDDTRFLAAALADLGVGISKQPDGSLVVTGNGGAPPATCDEIDIGEGGSTLRFLLPLLATQDCRIRLNVAEALMARPHQELVALLQTNGSRITADESGFEVNGVAAGLPSPTMVPVGLSSQFLSGLLMASGNSKQIWQLDEVPVSQGYLNMTLKMMRQFRGDDCVEVRGSSWYQAAGFGSGQQLQIPADASAALFFAVAAALTDSTVILARASSPDHPDEYALRFLEEAGFMTRREHDFIGTARTAVAVRAFDLRQSPDSGPAMAVLAASNPTGIRFENADRLRHKESDRIDGMERLAQACGGELSQKGDSLWVRAVEKASQTCAFDPSFDHRLAMAAGVAALRWPGIQVTDPGVVAKSFPDFWNQLAQLR